MKGKAWKTRFKQWTWIFFIDISLKHWSSWPRDGAVDLPNQKARLAGGSRWFKHLTMTINWFLSLPDPGGISQLLPHFFHIWYPVILRYFNFLLPGRHVPFGPSCPVGLGNWSHWLKISMRHDARDGTKKMGQEWIGLGDIIDISSTQKWSSHQEWQQTWLRWELSFTLYNS